jgi:hypothetical protein
MLRGNQAVNPRTDQILPANDFSHPMVFFVAHGMD